MDIDVTRRNKKPRALSENERAKLDEFIDNIHYSARSVLETGRQMSAMETIPSADCCSLLGTPTTNMSTDMFNFRNRCLRLFQRSTLTAQGEP